MFGIPVKSTGASPAVKQNTWHAVRSSQFQCTFMLGQVYCIEALKQTITVLILKRQRRCFCCFMFAQ